MTAALLALLVAVAAAFCLASFMLARSRTDQFADLTFYRQQLRDLETGSAGGASAEGDREATRLELARRLLRADADKRRTLQDSRRMRQVAASVSVIVTVSMVGLYWTLGAPDLAGQSAARVKQPVPAGAGADGPSMPELLGRLRDHLEDDPDNLQGWTLLGRSLLSMGRGAAAAAAYQRAIALNPDDAALQAGLGEALVQIADGQVSPAARLAFERAQTLDPDNAAPAYYLGLAAMQNGDPRRALAIWEGLAAAAPENAPWLVNLHRQIAMARARIGAQEGPPQLSRELMAAVAEMSDGERQAFIESMVDRLESRLAENPDDWRGWLRLARARNTLGDPVAALAALKRAREVAPPSAESILTQEEETISQKNDIKE